MKKYSMYVLIVLFPVFVTSQHVSKSDRARSIVDAINIKDAKQYVENFSNDVKVYMYEENGSFVLRIDGKKALFENRATHLKDHPDVRNEIQHLAKIDNRLIMHDIVWLTPKKKEGSSVVEIFTFNKEGKISRVDVIQQKNLFNPED